MEQPRNELDMNKLTIPMIWKVPREAVGMSIYNFRGACKYTVDQKLCCVALKAAIT